MKHKLTTLLFLFVSVLAFAQNSSNDSLSDKNNLTAGFNIYGIAPGVFVEKNINDKLKARVGGNYLSFRIPQAVFDLFDVSDTIITVGNFNTGRFFLGLDYKIKGNFYATAGLQYHEFTSVVNIGFAKDYRQNVKVDVNNTPNNLKDDMTGTIIIPKELIGNIRITIDTEKKIVPFLGLIYSKTFKKGFGFKVETGAIFQGKILVAVGDKIFDTGYDDVSNPGTTIKIDMKDSKEYKKAMADLNSRIDKVTILPYLSLSFTYKLF